ncbi:MAG TPA: hypothetical protein VK196_17090 [Magnetospirillum sp.]|nr:hypothetical protein [Magnetospirillum sp.]
MKTDHAIAALKSGGFLMAEHEDGGELKYRCVPGGGITPKQAALLIRELGLQTGGDALFPDVTPQTWRL